MTKCHINKYIIRVTKEIDRIAGEIAKELEPKLFEMVSWGLDNTDLEKYHSLEGDEFIELVTHISNQVLTKLKNNINE